MRPSLKPLSEQVIVITGGTSGIGLATAESAAEQGARLVIAARNAQALGEVATRLGARGAQIATCAADVANADEVERIAQTAIERFGRIDTWVNDAAAAIYGKVEEVPIEDHRRVFEVGYWGTVYGSLTAVKHLRRNGGALINLGSVLSERTMILQGPYSAMKQAVRGFTDALRMELEAEGAPISVTLIKPTGMNTPYPEHARNYMARAARIPPVVYDPRLVARAILFSAETPRREITVGGTGLMISKLGSLLPRAMDLNMEMTGESMQQIDQPPPPQAHDNLYEPREDGRIESEQDIYVRRSSLWLEAQLRPGLTTAVLGGIGLLAAAIRADVPRRARDRLRQPELQLRRHRAMRRRQAAE